jgi:hypothetical protein
MSDTPVENKKAVDPLEPWRELRDAYIDVWAKATGEAVQSEAYAQASGVMLETVLSASSPFRDAQKKVMVSALEQLNMPSRADFVSLAERLSNLELLLDDMDAKLTQIHQLAISAASQPAPRIETETKANVAATNAASQPAPKIETETKANVAATSAASQTAPKIEPETKSDHAATSAALQPVLKIEPEVKFAASGKSAKTAKKGSR